MNELAVIMRSLGMNPTKTELTNYMRQKNSKMAFSDFLEIMHSHTSVTSAETLPRELLQAFKNYDEKKRGVIHAKDLRRILTRWGEHLSPKEGMKPRSFRIEQIHKFLFFSSSRSSLSRSQH